MERDFGFGYPRVPTGYVEKYMSDVRDFSMTVAQRRLDNFTMDLVINTDLPSLFRLGAVHIRYRDNTREQLMGEMRARDLRAYAQDGMIALLIEQEIVDDIERTFVRAIMARMDSEGDYAFRTERFTLPRIMDFLEQFLIRGSETWIYTVDETLITARSVVLTPEFAGIMDRANRGLVVTDNRRDLTMQLLARRGRIFERAMEDRSRDDYPPAASDMPW